MVAQDDGTFVATGVVVQNRANLANANARAGVYISRLEEVYKANQGTHRFVTPAVKKFSVVKGAGNDIQMIGGTYNITYNPADSSIVFDLVGEYPWHDNVYVVGSILNVDGQKHRWKNDEMAPLAHKGNGIYSGIVTFYRDDQENMYPNFTIFSCRSNTASIEHSTATRGGWNEGRYGNEENKLILEDGVTMADLIRGVDRKWYMNWDESVEGDAHDYLITFDMNHGTVRVGRMKGDVNDDSEANLADYQTILGLMARDADVSENPAADVNGDGEINLADAQTILGIMAAQ